MRTQKANNTAPAPRAKALPREVAMALVGHIHVQSDESADGLLCLTVRRGATLVGRAYGHGLRETLVEVAREHFGPGGILKRSRGAPGSWLVFR